MNERSSIFVQFAKLRRLTILTSCLLASACSWHSESFADELAREDAAYAEQIKAACTWQKWFAWKPVGVGGEDFEFEAKKRVWFVTVERKGTMIYCTNLHAYMLKSIFGIDYNYREIPQ